MELSQYQIDIFGYTESQVEHINGLLKFAFSQGENKGIDELKELQNKSK